MMRVGAHFVASKHNAPEEAKAGAASRFGGRSLISFEHSLALASAQPAPVVHHLRLQNEDVRRRRGRSGIVTAISGVSSSASDVAAARALGR